MQTGNEVADHIEKLQKMVELLYEAHTIIITGRGTIDPYMISEEALRNFLKLGAK
jgi:DNA-binding MurR/RpiR family transcriptional regulator